MPRNLDEAYEALDELRSYEQAAAAGMEDEWLDAKYAEDIERYDAMQGALNFGR